VPFLRELLLSDSIYIGSNLTFENLTPVSAYLGKPGDPGKGGLSMDEYRRRQEQFRQSEIHALMDTAYFIERAKRLYDYPHFICDTGGSICEWVDAENPDDPILKELSEHTLMIWLKGDDEHTAELIRRFDLAPKPMAYQPAFLADVWQSYLTENDCDENDVDPNAFIRWTYAQALAHRQPRYEAMAKWGITLDANDLLGVTTPAAFDRLIETALERM
ncbi:MAG: ATPase, partial [Arenibacterium sp.]